MDGVNAPTLMRHLRVRVDRVTEKKYEYQPSGRRLSDAQLKLPFFRMALRALEGVTSLETGVLPRLWRHESGRQVRSEVRDALRSLAHPLLVRLDLASATLGWLDERGQLRLSNQRQLASDAGLSRSALSRHLALYERAGYVRLSTKKLTRRQSRYLWTVRSVTTITFTRLFFRHLGAGCYRAYVQARKWAIKRRNRQESKTGRTPVLAAKAAADKRNADRLQAQRKRKFESWRNTQQARDEAIELNRVLAQVAIDPAYAHGTPAQLREAAQAILAQLHPV